MLELRSVGLKFAHYVAEKDGRLIATIIDEEEYEYAKTIEGESFDVCLIQGRYTLETDGKVILAPRSIGGGDVEFSLLGRTFQVTPKRWTPEPYFLIKKKVGLIRAPRSIGGWGVQFSLLGRTYQVTPKRWALESDFLIKEQKKEVGLIRITGSLHDTAVGEFPDSFSNLIGVFILWMTLTRGIDPFQDKYKLTYNDKTF